MLRFSCGNNEVLIGFLSGATITDSNTGRLICKNLHTFSATASSFTGDLIGESHRIPMWTHNGQSLTGSNIFQIPNTNDISIGKILYTPFSPGEVGTKLFFGGTNHNTDPISLYRFNVGADRSELRLSVGDNNLDSHTIDTFKIGQTPYATNTFIPGVTINPNGRIGIGTESPKEELHISSNLSQSHGGDFLVQTKKYTDPSIAIVNRIPNAPQDKGNNYFTMGVGTQASVIMTDAPYGFLWSFGKELSDTLLSLWATPNRNDYNRKDDVLLLTQKNSNTVTNSPTLHNSSLLSLSGNLLLTNNLHNPSHSHSHTGAGIFFGVNDTDEIGLYRYNHKPNTSELRLQLADDDIANNADADKFTIGSLLSGKWTPKFSLLANGKMGIGTDNPIESLEVNGHINVGSYSGAMQTPGTSSAGNRLFFDGAVSNSDPVYMYRYNRDENKTDARFVIGDDSSNNKIDRFQIGTTNPDSVYNVSTFSHSFASRYSDIFHPKFTFTSDGKLGIGTEDPQNSLDVVGNASVSQNMNVGGSIATQGNISVSGALSVGGVTNLHNTFIDGNVVVNGTLGFTDPNNAPWLDKGSNLPLFKFGGVSYIKPQISPVAGGGIMHFAYSRIFMFYEPTGEFVMLRPGTDGEFHSLYYSYSKRGEPLSDDFIQTSMAYEPDFLKGPIDNKRYYPFQIMDGNDTSFSLEVRTKEQLDTVKKYYLVTQISTLDPATHTEEKVIDISNNTMFPSKYCTYIEKIRLIACNSGEGWTQGLYLYRLENDGKTVIPVSIYNTFLQTDTIGTTLLDMDNTQFFQQTDTNYTLHTKHGDHTNAQNIQYYLDGNTLYLQTQRNTLPLYRYVPTNSLAYHILEWNLIVRVDFSQLTSHNRVTLTPENHFPIRYNAHTREATLNDNFSVLLQSHNSKPSHTSRLLMNKVYAFPKKNRIFMMEAREGSPGYTLYQFQQNGLTMLDYMRGIPNNVREIKKNGSVVAKNTKRYFVPDVSLIGKELKHARFIARDKILLQSQRFTKDSSKIYPIIATIPMQGGKLTFPRKGNYNNISDSSSLPLPNKVEEASAELAQISSQRLDSQGNIISYAIDQVVGQVRRFREGQPDGIVNIGVTNLMDRAKEDIAHHDAYYMQHQNDQDISNKQKQYLLFVVDDTHILFTYALMVSDTPTTRREHRGYILYQYGQGVWQKKVHAIAPGSSLNKYDYYLHGDRFTGRALVSYTHNNKTYFAYLDTISGPTAHSPYIFFGEIVHHASQQPAMSFVAHKYFYQHYLYPVISIHPQFGLVQTSYDARHFSYQLALGIASNVESMNSLSNRIIQSFEQVKHWYASTTDPNKKLYGLISSRVAEGFILYTQETPIFYNGIYSKLPNASYNLTDPKYGLVPTSNDTSKLKNTQIYVTIDANEGLVNPKLAFSFKEPTTPLIAVLRTDDFGIREVLLQDGLSVTVEDLYVKKVRVSNHLEMKGDDGKMYIIKINQQGQLQVLPKN